MAVPAARMKNDQLLLNLFIASVLYDSGYAKPGPRRHCSFGCAMRLKRSGAMVVRKRFGKG
jgi:hypothetical protein